MYTAFRGCVPRRVYTPWDVTIYRLTEPLPAFPFDFFVLALFWIWNKALGCSPLGYGGKKEAGSVIKFVAYV